ncbi:hypothetical protein [Sinomonas sp. ASV322]|uniref:hypothetical protein n=1 Tax=Sinomonas sp. ASV322 TaxID=3041920 RepID=UPI0027DC05EC|nr:hypothetical protein [Sinomonas sp. ASV322]MDQ4500890.1 hypothetical protein [Sinomonas sp. ASV322]
MENQAAHLTASPRSAVRRRWPELAAPITAICAALYAAAAGLWLALGHQYPFGTGTFQSPSLLTRDWPSQSAAVLAIGAALAGSVLAGLVARRRRPGRLLTGAVVVFATAFALAFLTVVADTSMLAILGYLPFMIVKLVSDPGWFAGRDIPWAGVANEYAVLAGSVLWIAVAVVTVRRRVGACLVCGRPGLDASRAHRPAARRSPVWGAAAVWTAIAIPLIYAATRFAWAVGIPLGLDDDFYRWLRSEGGLSAAVGLASMAAVGAVLTWGLIARWGERIPAWVPGLGGHDVPVAAAVVPALFVASVIFPAGLQMIREGLGLAPGLVSTVTPADWGAYGPTLLWPLWSVALSAGAISYWLRRRGACPRCGRAD